MAFNPDLVFRAIADPTRRAILERLCECDLTVGELAEPFDMSLQAVSAHLTVLERAGLVRRARDAQWRTVALDPRPLRGVTDWLAPFEQFWLQGDPTRHGDVKP
jgi:DNA-binding transcriptional ArsR family regulator